MTLLTAFDVNINTSDYGIRVHFKNSLLHYSAETVFVQTTNVDFLIVHAAVMPVRVLPAPQGRTIMPDLAL